MKGYNDTQMALFEIPGRLYRISKVQERAGSGTQRTLYFLNKIIFNANTRLRIRINSETAELIVKLSKSAGISLCETLITERLCMECKSEKRQERGGNMEGRLYQKPVTECGDECPAFIEDGHSTAVHACVLTNNELPAEMFQKMFEAREPFPDCCPLGKMV